MEEKREWGAAALCHRERDIEKQPRSIRLNIDKHAATITATLGTRKKNELCVCPKLSICLGRQTFAAMDEEKEYYKPQTKGHWSQGYVPRKNTLKPLQERVKKSW